MNFVYPGYNGKPILSLRYEQLRRGIGDYELLHIAQEKGLQQAVESFYNRVVLEQNISSFFPVKDGEIRPVKELCSLVYEDYSAARAQLLAALDKEG